MAPKQRGLGRGLGALIDDFSSSNAQNTITSVSLHKIEPNPNQPRRQFDPEELQALSESIAEHGIIQPIAVRAASEGYYQIIAGERRWRAARQAGLSEVPVLIIEADDKKVMELALVENLQRQDLNPMEEAEGYETLMKTYSMTQEQVSERVGKSRSAVANALRLLQLPDEIRGYVTDGTLSAGHARAVLSVSSEKLQKIAAQRIIALRLSVRQAETMCKRIEGKKEETVKSREVQVDYIGECEKHLTRQLGRKVKIVSGKRKGHVEVEFYGQEDLQALYELLDALPSRQNKK